MSVVIEDKGDRVDAPNRASDTQAAEKRCINQTALVRRSPGAYLWCSYRLGRILDCLRRENQRIMG